MSNYLEEQTEEGIAIIGMDGRFPGASNVAEFWQNIRDGVESITFFEDEELLAAGVTAETLADPNYVKAGSVIDKVDLFDATFFGISPREAKSMDPQHRLLLECAWGALESSGETPANYDGRIGVYAGSSMSTYLQENLLTNPDFLKSTGDLQIEIGNDKDFMPTRISYKLNLTGPSICINTACSTSLVSVHVACQGLLDRECDMALAGGATITLPQTSGYLYEEGSITTPDGHCRPFDADAKGTIFGSGVGMVLLKRLEDAIADRDPILAVIKGSAVNNDGSLKVGYTAPSVDGQAEAIAEALEIAEIDPETITYIENHGTGTAMGDPIEIAALSKVFRKSTSQNGFCAIGSVKGNIGHLNRASGIIGLIKTVLALKHKAIPPSINYQQPNPQIDFANSPFYVNTELKSWQTDGTPRRAGVSSFGVGGTNAHLVLEEAPERRPSSNSRPWQLLTLSAKTEPALADLTQNLAEHLAQTPDLNLADIAYTLKVGREDWQHRRILVCQDQTEAVQQLQNNNFFDIPISPKLNVSLMFSGQGSQYVNMGKELYECEPLFREQVDYCCELLKPKLGLDLRDLLYPETDQIESATKQLTETRFTQPALFIIEYATACLWMSWGVKPVSLIGHSIGEYAAACIAGVFSLEDALLLVTERGALMQGLPAGSMLSVFLPEKKIKPLLTANLDLAVLNAPDSCVVSGTDEAIAEFETKLDSLLIDYRRLHTSHAFHSVMMEPILATFTERVSQVKLNPPQIPYISNVSGTWITPEEATNPSYWAKHLRSTVRFAAGAKELLNSGGILLEVGPGRMLKSLALKQASNQVVLSSLRHPKEETSDLAFMLNTLGQLWQAGVELDWSSFYQQEQRDRLALPTYPFQRERYWVEPKTSLLPQLASGNKAALVKQLEKTGQFSVAELQLLPKLLETLGKSELNTTAKDSSDLDNWFYEIAWQNQPLANAQSQSSVKNWLIFADSQGVGKKLAAILGANGQVVTVVTPAQQYQQVAEQEFQIEPNSPSDYAKLWADLGIQKSTQVGIVHLWSLDTVAALAMTTENLREATALSCRSTLNLVQYLANSGFSDSSSLWLVTKGAQTVDTETKLPGLSQSSLWGMGKVISLEYPELNCITIDLNPDLTASDAQSLSEEITSLDQSEDRVVWRDRDRYVPRLARKEVKKPNSKNQINGDCTYLITGGLKGLGLSVASWLAEQGAKQLVLLGRSKPIPTTAAKIAELEANGVKVTVAQADVTQTEQMAAVFAQIDKTLPPLKGVFHAAGILDDGVLQQLEWSKFARVLAPKIEGAWNLHNLTKDKSLDFFVLFSSVASLLGFPGQANHVAANTFLDSLAHYRQSQDLAGLSINWGLWADVGTAVDKQVAGIEKITAKSALQALKRLLAQASPQVGVVPIDWSEYGHQFSSASKPFLSNLISSQQSSAVKLVSPEEIKAAAPEELSELLIAYIRDRVARALSINSHELDQQYPLNQMGLDSLMAIQLRNSFKSDLGVNIVMSEFMENTTVNSLSELFSSQLAVACPQVVEAIANPDDDDDWLEGEI